jgi:hypothetical protein
MMVAALAVGARDRATTTDQIINKSKWLGFLAGAVVVQTARRPAARWTIAGLLPGQRANPAHRFVSC